MDSRRTAAFRRLGIPADSDQQAVARAYRRLVRITHPDVSADPAAADQFVTLTAAYRLLSDAPWPDPDDTPTVEHEAASESTEDCEDSAGYQRPPGWARDDAWPTRIWPGVSAQSRQQRPIIAGPVHVSPPRDGARQGSA